jgi:acyl carrier protein
MSNLEKIFICVRDALHIDWATFDQFVSQAKLIRLREDLGLNEKNSVELYFKLRDIFPDFTMEAKDAEKLVTVQDAIDFVNKQIK